jgi:DNA-binding NtrC family response regulator
MLAFSTNAYRTKQTELKQFTSGALEKLSSYSWPGNTRQLENEVKRLVASVRGKSITEDHLDDSIRNQRAPVQSCPPQEKPAKLPTSQSLPDAVERLERRLIEEALQNSGGNKQKAAQALGLSRQGLIKKLKRLGVS